MVGPLTLRGVVVCRQVGCDVPRIHLAVEHHLHLLDDGHVDLGFARELQDRSDGGEAFRRLLHLLHDVLEAVPLTEQASRRVVPAQRRLARGDQVAETGEALERLRMCTVGHREVRHLDESARDDRCLRVLPVPDAVDDADGDRDQVLEDAAELRADHVGVHEGAEILVASRARDDIGRLLTAGGDHGCGGLLTRDLQCEVRPRCHGDAVGIAAEFLLDHLAHAQTRAAFDALHEADDLGVAVGEQRAQRLQVLAERLARHRQVHLFHAVERCREFVGGRDRPREVDAREVA